MKKIISGSSAGRLLLILFAVICAMLISARAFCAEEPIARLTSFSGTVLIKSQGSWGVKPNRNLPLYSKDKLVTRIGLATITFNDGAVMEVRPNSNLLIQESEEDTGIEGAAREVKRRLRLLLGKMLFRTNRSSTIKTNLETTTMVCGLRGTEGIISIGTDGQTYLQFTEGGGVTVGAFISGVATDVPTELANLNPVQRAAFVASAAASQATQAAEAAATGEISDADAAMKAAQAAEAAAQEAKTSAEAMLTNPDPEIQEEANLVIESADEAIDDAKDAQDKAIDSGATPGATEGEAGGEEIGFDVEAEEADYSEWGLTEEDRRVRDNIPPLISLSSTPTQYTNLDTALFGFSIEDNLTESNNLEISYTIDGEDPVELEPVSEEPYNYSLDFSGLTEQQHEITITAIDETGNIGEINYIWTTDYTAPIALFSTTPATIANTSSFSLDAEDANKDAGITYQYSLDGGTWTTTSASLDLGLATDGTTDGVHEITVKATDVAGNTGEPSGSYSWTYDTTAPVIAVANQPAALTNIKEVSLSVDYTNPEPGTVTFGYTMDGSVVDSASLTGLLDGSHSLVVTATDQAGNISTDTTTWEVDATAPVNMAVSKSTTSETIDFSLSSEDANDVTYSWSLLDGSGAIIKEGDGVSASIIIEDLTDGNYTFTWVATDVLGNSASGNVVGFTFDTYLLAGDVSGTGSVITGTEEGQVSITGGEDWGSKSIASNLMGTWTGEHSGTISIASGGNASGSTEEGLWLSTITGSISGTDATGTSDFTMLTPTTLLQGTGDFSGTFLPDYTWSGTEEASSLTYTTLTFSSIFSGTEAGGLFRMFDGTYHEGDFDWETYDPANDNYYWSDYHYEYFLADSYFDFSGGTPVVSDVDTILFGVRELDDDYAGDYIWEIYLPYGRQPGQGIYLDMEDYYFPLVDWAIGSLSSDYFTNPTDLGIDLTSLDLTDYWYSEESANILALSGGFSGIMGGTGDIWSSANITLLGEYEPWDGDYSEPLLFSADIASSEITVGGAYRGFMFGSVVNPVTGDLYALYVKDDGSGGILSGDFSGSTYKDIGRWNGEGSVTATQYAQNTGITPDTVDASLDKGIIAGWVGGDFGTSGSFLENYIGWGRTLSLTNNEDWGIFELLLGGGNYFYNPEGSSTWTARSGGLIGITGDYGYWMTNEISGTAVNGMLSADVTGKLLTLTQYSDLTGSLIGTYDMTGANTWQAIVGGYWNNSQPLYFSGETWGEIDLATEWFGGYAYNDTDFSYNYEVLTGSGWSWEYNYATGETIATSYNPDGTYEQRTIASDGTITYSEGSWGSGDLLTYLEGIADTYTTHYDYSGYSLYDVGWLDGAIGGLDPLWEATSTAPADIIMIGEFDTDDEGDYYMPSVFSSEIESHNPHDMNETIWSQADSATIGAYFGYAGGISLTGTDSIPIQGDILALYVDNSGYAGYLRGSFDGDAYQNARVWEATGTVYPEQVGSVGIAPENFEIAQGGGWGSISGELGNPGTINYDPESDYYDTVEIETASIIDESTSTALPWGIYSGTFYGSFNNPDNATTWTSRLGGEASFGAYFYDMGGWSNDWGPYIASTNSSWLDGILSADLTGRFLTYTKLGTMEGNVQGTYNDSSQTWQAVSLGTWSETDLAFASYDEFNADVSYAVISYVGQFDYTGGGYYYYSYYSDNSYGYTQDHPTSSWYPYIYTSYSIDGITYSYSYDTAGNYLGSTRGTWTGNLADIVTVPTPPTGEEYVLNYTDEYINSNYSGWLENVFMGGTNSLWTGSNIPFTLMGSYYDYGVGSIWSTSPIYSYNYKDNTYTTYDGGAYYGYIGGISLDSGSIDILEGSLTALYIDKNGNAGFLVGPIAGSGYPDISMFEMDGSINRVEMVQNIGIAAGDLYFNIEEGYPYYYGEGAFSGGGTIPGYYTSGSSALIMNHQDWGIAKAEAMGEYDGNTSDSWSMSIVRNDGDQWLEIYGTQWSDGKIFADDATGAWVDIYSAMTGVNGGEVIGTFNPNTFTWEAVMSANWIETSKFLAMADPANTEGNAALNALNIPYIEIGSTDLTGSGGNLTNVTMTDVKFFAYSDGAAPRIWATDAISGTTNGSSPVNSTAYLSGSRDTTSFSNVEFTVNSYGGVGGNWDASVSGTGTVAGQTGIDIIGGAAGTVDASDATLFSGTAAGVAK